MSAATPQEPKPDLSDVQGEILQPYDYAVGIHLLVGFSTPDGARAFVRGQLPNVTRASDVAGTEEAPAQLPSVALNIGFTYSGLFAMGLDTATLESFPYPFRVGMAFRAPVLGDTGASAPDQWTAPYGSREVHAWLHLQSNSPDALEGRVEAILRSGAQTGVSILHTEPTANFTGAHATAKEHFGFNDGIGNPAIEGSPEPDYPGRGTPLPPRDGNHDRWGKIALGSFLLGYPDEYGETLPFPANPELRQNGTFMAFRKLEQHVTKFRTYIDENKHLVGGDSELLAAKMVGRWRSGAPLELSPDKDDPELAKDPWRNNDFRYDDDVEGLNVPHLAHIRRVNPRDALPPDSVIEPRRHRIVRRSMPYGPWLPEGEQDTGGRGLIFRVFNANFLDQFEVVQSQWVGSANESGGLSTDQDVIAGLTDPTGSGEQILQSTMRIPRKDGMVTLYGLPRFVTLKGGDYFFVPGIGGLGVLVAEPADGQSPGGEA